MVHLKKIHEGIHWIGYRAVIYFILTKQIFLHFYHPVNKTDKKRYLDDDDTGVKPKHLLQRGMRYTSEYEADGHLAMMSCLQNAVINYAPRIGK